MDIQNINELKNCQMRMSYTERFILSDSYGLLQTLCFSATTRINDKNNITDGEKYRIKPTK